VAITCSLQESGAVLKFEPSRWNQNAVDYNLVLLAWTIALCGQFNERMDATTINKGRYYSNGAYGRSWGVRMVLGIDSDPDSGLPMVSYKGIAGACRRKAATCTLEVFSNWAKYEVGLNENSWQRVN
jgi:hypothetical protein